MPLRSNSVKRRLRGLADRHGGCFVSGMTFDYALGLAVSALLLAYLAYALLRPERF